MKTRCSPTTNRCSTPKKIFIGLLLLLSSFLFKTLIITLPGGKHNLSSSIIKSHPPISLPIFLYLPQCKEKNSKIQKILPNQNMNLHKNKSRGRIKKKTPRWISFFPKVFNMRSHVLLKIQSPYTEPNWEKVIKSNKEGIDTIDDLDLPIISHTRNKSREISIFSRSFQQEILCSFANSISIYGAKYEENPKSNRSGNDI